MPSNTYEAPVETDLVPARCARWPRPLNLGVRAQDEMYLGGQVADSTLIYGQEFQEIGHCGGQFTVNVQTTANRHRALQFGIRHSRPTPASWFAVYVLPPGV